MEMSVVEHYRDWLARLPKAPAARTALAHAAVDAYEAIEHKRRLSVTDLAPLMAAARSPLVPVCGTGCNLLVVRQSSFGR
jgi:hypothetical protein